MSLTARQRALLRGTGGGTAKERVAGTSGADAYLKAEVPVSVIDANGAAANGFVLGDGVVEGQCKYIILGTKAAGGAAEVKPTNLHGGTKITLDTALKGVSLIWAFAKWKVTGGDGVLA